MQKHHHRLLVGLLVVVFATLATLYALHTPPAEGTDEVHHLEYAAYIARTGRLPVQHEGMAAPVVMVHHPPLYYALGALILTQFDTADADAVLRPNPHFIWDENGRNGWRVMLDPPPTASRRGALGGLYALRIMGILIGCSAVVTSYLGAQHLFPNQPWVPLGVTAVATLNPAFLAMAGTVHHDILLSALLSAGLLWCLCLPETDDSWQTLVAGGLLAGAAALTKITGLVLVPMMLAACAARGSLSARLRRSAVVLVVAALSAGWWYIGNKVVYDDWTRQPLFAANFSHMLRQGRLTWPLFRLEFLGQLAKTYWGAFGYMHILLPERLRLLVWACAVSVSAGWVVWAVRTRARMAPHGRTILAWALALGELALLMAGLIRLSFYAFGAGQGRYLLGAAMPVAAVIVGGLYQVTGWRLQRLLSPLLVVIMVSYAWLAPYRYVWPRYETPQSVSPDEVAGSLPAGIVFEGGVQLVAFSYSPSVLVPDGECVLTTYWQAVPSSAYADAYVLGALEANDGQTLDQREFWPEINSSPAGWAGRTVRHVSTLHVPSSVQGGTARMTIQVLDGEGGAPLSVVGHTDGGASVLLAEAAVLGSVQSVDIGSVPAQDRGELLAESFRLLAVNLPESTAPGSFVPVVFYWEVARPSKDDYTVFTHVVDSQGRVVAQLDRPPGGGSSPTSTWRQGQILQDSYPVELPVNLAPGEYRVVVGMYTWPDLTRAEITKDQASIGDALEVGTFAVLP